MKNTEIIMIRETLMQSILRDAVSVGCAGGLIGFGVLLDSAAMQWFGFVLAAFFLLAVSARTLKASPRMTPQEAADYLRQTYGVEAMK